MRFLLDKYRKLRMFIRRVVRPKNSFGIPLTKKIRANINGFTADQYIRYNLEEARMDDYLSEYERWKTRKINGRFNFILDDKISFYEVFSKYLDIPKNLAWIDEGRVNNLAGSLLSDQDIYELIKEVGQVIIKPVIMGGAGKGISMLSSQEDGSLELNYEKIGYGEAMDFIRSHDDSIITELVKQGPYSSQLYSRTTNTIRLVTVNDGYDNYRLIAGAHRIGRATTIPVDNAAQGALVAEIDIESGRLGPARTYFDQLTYDQHPDSGAQIQGVKIPGYRDIRARLEEVASYFPYIKFIAWDVVVREDGFSVIEGNASTGLDLFQLWGGVAKGELGQFYKRQGII